MDKVFSTQLDLERKNGIEGKDSPLERGNSVCVGATPPASMEELGIGSMMHCILLGPLLFNFVIKTKG